jgi:hypothetical protein
MQLHECFFGHKSRRVWLPASLKIPWNTNPCFVFCFFATPQRHPHTAMPFGKKNEPAAVCVQLISTFLSCTTEKEFFCLPREHGSKCKLTCTLQVEAKPAAAAEGQEKPERKGWSWGALAALDGVSIRSLHAPTIFRD